MRPRQSSLGIFDRRASPVPRSLISFNEAEAIKPRNLDRAIMKLYSRRTRCFNEAEAIKPRNHANETVGTETGRPRQSSLGMLDIPLTDGPGLLQ